MARRCWGITQNKSRCSRHGAWWLFCDEHFSLKSTLLIASFCAALIAVLANTKTLLSEMFDDKAKFIGTWEEDFEFQYGGANARVDGQVSYFKNGRYNFIGELSYSIPPKHSVTLTYKLLAAGTWTADDSTLTISREDHNYEFSRVNTGLGVKIDELLKNKIISENKFDLKIINGISDQYQILGSSRNQIELEGTTPDKIKFTIKMAKI